VIIYVWYSISGTFGRAMIHILARRSLAKIPMASVNTLVQPSRHDIVAISGQ